MQSPIDVAVNPNNQAQRYILWTNGRIDNLGGAPPIVGPGWYDRIDTVAMALWITDWVAGKGYVLDWQGGFTPLGGAPDLMTETQYPLPSVPGVEYVTYRKYVDWTWNPNGSGQGYVMDLWGQLFHFGGATPAPRQGPRLGQPDMRRVKASWGGTQRMILMDMYGGLYGEFGLNLPTLFSNTYYPGWDAARDVAITEWTSTTSVKGYTLDLFGAVLPFGGAVVAPYGPWQHADVARTLRVLSASNPLKLWQVWANGQSYEYISSDPPTVVAGAGATEIQQITKTGTSTAGTFTLTINAQTTTAIAHNASGATVAAALNALSSIGAGGVTVVAAAGTNPQSWTVTFSGAAFAYTDVAQITVTPSGLTGATIATSTLIAGTPTAPPATVTTTTRPTLAWSYSDPERDSQAGYEVYVFTQADVTANSITTSNVGSFKSTAKFVATGIDPSTRGVTPDFDLANGTWRYYVRAQDISGQWSAWATRGWTQSITLPTTPGTPTATISTDPDKWQVSLSATTAGTASFVRFEFSDDVGVTWTAVRGAESQIRASTTTATDYDIPPTVTRRYRAISFSTTPRVASSPSASSSSVISANTPRYVLTSTADPTLGGVVNVDQAPEWSRSAVAGVFPGSGAKFYTVVSDGVPKARKGTLQLIALDKAGWDRIKALVQSDTTLLLRDPFGEAIYCRVAGDWTQVLKRAGGGTSNGSVANMRTTSIPLVEIAQPTVI